MPNLVATTEVIHLKNEEKPVTHIPDDAVTFWKVVGDKHFT
jgi:hypothetical protein